MAKRSYPFTSVRTRAEGKSRPSIPPGTRLEYPSEKKQPAARRILIDAGTAATGISDLRPDVRRALADRPEQVEQLSMIAYLRKANPKILIIGSGAGGQVLGGLQRHASSITAVEINPVINDIEKMPVKSSMVAMKWP